MKRLLRRLGLLYHSQNLNELPGERYGSILRHGRAWLHFGDNAFGWEWVTGRLRCGFGLTVDACGGEHDLSGHITIPGLSFYWHLDHAWPRRFRQPLFEWWKRRWGYDGRDIGIDFHDGSLWVKVWAPENEWSSSQPKWMDWHFDPADFFLGRHKYTSRVLEKTRVEVPMPEGVYPAEVEVFESTWKRPRWPWARVMLRTTITPDEAIPVPGKGENAWDCDEDAIYSQTCGQGVSTPTAAVVSLVESVLEARERHGGRGWRPEKVEVS